MLRQSLLEIEQWENLTVFSRDKFVGFCIKICEMEIFLLAQEWTMKWIDIEVYNRAWSS